METILVPGDSGRNCPGNPEYCDECDYLICCNNFNGLCDNCLAENGLCKVNARHMQVTGCLFRCDEF